MNQSPSPSQAALRRLLIVLAAVIAFGVYSYGWTVTSIDLETPQEATRQQNVGNALRELLSPRIFEQEREQVTQRADFLVDCEQGAPPSLVVPQEAVPYITIEPTCGVAGDVVTVTAHNFAPDSQAEIRWIPARGQSRPREVLATGRTSIILTSEGGFTGQIEVPRISGSTGEMHAVGFVASVPSGPVHFSETTHEVIRRMIETIFMALVATSLSIPIAAVLSFFAAHNLMRPIRLPVGNMMVTVIMLPIGWWLGSLLLGALGRFAFDLSSGQLLGISASVPLIFLLGTTAASRGIQQARTNDPTTLLRGIISLLLTVVAAAFVIGLLGGLGILGSDLLQNAAESFRPAAVSDVGTWLVNAAADGLSGIGYMIGILGGLIELLLLPMCGILGAFALSSVVGRVTTPALRYVTPLAGHIIGGVLGALSGAIVLAAVAAIAMTTALLSLITPIIAAMLGGQIASALYTRLTGSAGVHGTLRRSGRSIAWFVGAALVFVLAFQFLHTGRALIDGILPSTESVSFLFLQMPQYMFNAALIGLLLGAPAGALVGTHANFNLGDVLYNVTRTILNATRSIEPLIMGLIFVIWVGIGPFAGVLALTLHSIASLGKLYSEQIETIDEGPIEALRATGASHIQTIIYAVVPQIVPPYIAFTMYRWDINVRMSTIIGFVGGGGIGLLLNQQINLLRYRDAGVAVLAIAIVVSILDYASASIRERVG